MNSRSAFHLFSRLSLVLLTTSLGLCTVRVAGAADKSPRAAVVPGEAVAAMPGMPVWTPPPAYSVDMVMSAEGKTFTMKRFIDGSRIRSEISGEGQNMVMIELGDTAGTQLMVMPDQKQAIKMTSHALHGFVKEAGGGEVETAPEAPPADVKIEPLGDDKVDGVAAKKYRITSKEGDVLAWFDATSAAPLRMETQADGKKQVMEWKNLKVAPQPEKLFTVPKGYETTDMDEQLAKMQSMKGAGGMNPMTGLTGMGGMGGMGGMAHQAGQSFGQSMGAGFGSQIGAAFGGPLGAMAGQYIGGQVGGWLGSKAADAVTPGK